MTATARMVDFTYSDYERALCLEPRLSAAVRVVDALTALVRPSDRMCSACVWEQIVKPMVRDLVGWERGYLPDTVTRVTVGPAKVMCVSELLAMADTRRVPAETRSERWMRGRDAWDGFTGRLIERLHEADPGAGHGIGRKHRD